MRPLAIITLFLLMLSGKAQSFEKLVILKEHLSENNSKVPSVGIQVNQFLDNCIYEHACGQFSTGAIRSFGVIKGLALTIDRRTRCSQLARSQFLPIRLNTKGLIKDHWNDYRIEAK
ncbi:MAG: membrane protein insertion efficiency factor YidD [Cyclobacteriaceae bacterium]